MPLEAVRLPAPRVRVPAALARAVLAGAPATASATRTGAPTSTSCAACAGASRTRRTRSRGPRDEAELALVLEWCADERLAVVPYGGGTSVVGGVDAIPGPGHAGAVSVDLGRMDRVLEVDAVSRAARIQAGASGPRLEQQLGGI